MLKGFGQDSPDWVAIAQQVALIQSLYGDSEEYLRTLLDDDEEIVIYQRNRDTWPPSYLCVRRGDKYFVAIEGTTNTWQAFGHTPGIWLREEFLGDATVHGGWWDSARQIKATLPDMSEGFWYFSGHSYGGAVAAIMAMELVDQRGQEYVELVTMGAPKHMTNGYYGPLPKPYWRIEATTDLVPGLPPFGSEIFGTKWRNPLEWLRSDWVFWEYGDHQWINSKGEINGELYEKEARGDLNVIGFPGSHYLSNYWGRLNQRMLREGNPSEELTAWMQKAREGFDYVSPQTPVDPPQTVVDPVGEVVEIPIIPFTIYAGGNMAVYMVNLVFEGLNKRVWREGHAVNATSANEAVQLIKNNNLIGLRAAFMSRVYSIILAEATNLQNPRDGIVRDVQVRGSDVTRNAETAGVSVNIGYYLLGGYPQRWAPVRGFADGRMKFNKDTGDTELDTSVQSQIGAWVSGLKAAGFGAYVRLKEDPADPTLAKNFILSLNGDTSPGFTVVTCMNPINLGAATMASLHIRGEDNKRALPGLNGTVLPVVNVSGSTFTIPYTIPRGGVLAPGEKAYMRPARFAFANYEGSWEQGFIYARRTRRLK